VIPALLQQNPIVVSGLGVFSAAGANVDELWRSVLAGCSPATWQEFGKEPIAVCAAPALNLRSPEFRRVHKMDRSVHLAVAAARQAWEDADLSASRPAPTRLGIIVGTSRGPAGKWDESLRQLDQGRMLPSLAANSTLACLSGVLSVIFQAQGPSFTVSATCASSAHAIALAAQQILLGAADVMLVGGTEASLHAGIVRQLHTAGVLGFHEDPARTCRPFAADRNGTVLGEGAGFLVLESARCARERNARVLARLAGWALGSEGHQRTGIREDASGLFQVMTDALQMSGMAADEIGYVNAHGTGTPLNDRQEARALQRAFPGGVPCSSTKPVIGHCMGAGAAIEAVISILALQNGVLPPTAHCLPLDPECALDVVHSEPRRCGVRAVVSNSSGFWGNNASLVFAAPG
jgi:3-oxoacyl-(acyl-carrier-protein) synthase